MNVFELSRRLVHENNNYYLYFINNLFLVDSIQNQGDIMMTTTTTTVTTTNSDHGNIRGGKGMHQGKQWGQEQQRQHATIYS